MMRAGHWRWLLLSGLSLAAVTVTFKSRTSRSPAPLERNDLPPISASPYLNTNSDMTYVGTAACIRCHPQQHASYLETMHSRSLNDIDVAGEPPDATIEVPETRRIYDVYRADNRLRHRQSFRALDGTVVMLADHALRYVVGSGNLSRTYLVEADGFLVESPVTWYSAEQKWALSPGYEKEDPGFARPVYFECMNCHAGDVAPSKESDGLMSVNDRAIGCERCHGHGELHVRSRSTGTPVSGDFDATIVNPARLDRERAEAVCAQCHLDGDAAVELTGRRSRDYRPGLLWSDFRIDYGLKSSRGAMTVVGHVDQMRSSRCYQASDSMTCTTCHDPHSRMTAADRPAKYREKCLSCHGAQACRLDEPVRRAQSPEDDCTVCHMPKTSTDIPHVAATHHRVGIHGPAQVADDNDDLGELVPLQDVSQLPRVEQDRCLGLAYLQLSIKESDAERSNEYRLRARSLLTAAGGPNSHDGEVLSALAQCAGVDDTRQSIELAEHALQQHELSPRARVRAMFALCDAYCKEQRPGLAIPWFEKLVQLRRQGADWFRLAVCRGLTGDLAGAAQAARIAVQIMPEDPRFHELLVELSDKQGNATLAAEHRRLARQLRALREGDYTPHGH